VEVIGDNTQGNILIDTKEVNREVTNKEVISKVVISKVVISKEVISKVVNYIKDFGLNIMNQLRVILFAYADDAFLQSTWPYDSIIEKFNPMGSEKVN
jgi:hypothetical protein